MASNFTVLDVLHLFDEEESDLSEGHSGDESGEGMTSYLGGAASDTEEAAAWSRAVDHGDTPTSSASLPNLDPYVGSAVSGFGAMDTNGGDSEEEEYPSE